jgi:hypothetical protein
MRTSTASLGLLLVLLACAGPALAQDRRLPEGTVRVVLLDGETVVGRLLREDAEAVEIETRGGVRMTIPRAQIRSIESVAGQRFLRLDPNRTRLFFAPTGRPLERGTGYLADYELFFPFVSYGLTDRFIAAGGVSVIPGAPFQLVYLAPKLTVAESDRFSLAGGVMLNTVVGNLDDEDVPVFGLLYGVGTIGGPAAAVTFGLGLGYWDERIARNPVLLVGGEYQLSNSVKLLTENYYIFDVDAGVFLSGGIRFFGERLSADLGLVTNTEVFADSGGFPFFPWLGFAYNFGR